MAVRQVDERLRDEARRIQESRKRLARLASGEQLALPASVVSYLGRLRALGVEERYLELERDAWILVAAQIDAIMAGKHEDLNDPDIVRLYALLGGALDWSADDPRVVEVADLLDRVSIRAIESDAVREDGFDERFVDFLDSTMVETGPAARSLLTLLRERGWTGWTRLERIPADEDPDDDG